MRDQSRAPLILRCLLGLLPLAAAACTALPGLTSTSTPTGQPPATPTSSPTPIPSPTSLPAETPPPAPTPLPTAVPIGIENLSGLRRAAVAGAGSMGSLAVSPDGAWIAMSGSQGLWLIDKLSLQVGFRITAHAGGVNASAWSPDGSRLVTAGADGTVRIWQLTAAGPEQAALLVGHSGPVEAVAWSADGRLIASGGDDQAIRVWDAARFRQLRAFFHTSAIYALDWHPNSDWLLVGEFDGSISALSAGTGETLISFTPQLNWLKSVRWSPDGNAAATGGLDRELRIWDVSEGSGGSLAFDERLLIGTPFTIEALSWEPGGSVIAAAGGTPYSVSLYEPESGEPVPPGDGAFSGHQAPILGLGFAPGGVLLSSAQDNSLRVWDLESGSELRILSPENGPAFTGPLNAVDWSPDAERIATGGADGSLRIWSASGSGLDLLLPAHTNSVNSLDWSPGGQWIATGGGDNFTRIWDPETGELVQELRSEGGRVNAVAFSPFGNQLAAGGFLRIVQVWQAGADIAPTLLYPDVEITALGWSASGTMLAVGGSDGSVHLYDMAAYQEVGVFTEEHNTPIAALAWEQGGGRLAAIDRRGTIAVWDSATGERLARHPGSGGVWAGLGWSARGLLAAGSSGGTVVFYDGSTMAPLAEFAGHAAAVSDLRFSPDGANLVSVDSSGELVQWSLPPGPVEPLALSPNQPGRVGSPPENQWPSAGPLNPQNASETAQLAMIGRGTADLIAGHGDYIAVAGGAGTWIYAREDRVPLRFLEGGRAFGLRWSPDGRSLAVRELQMVRIWDVVSAQLLRAIPLAIGTQDALAWSPDGGMFAAADRQGNVVVYSLFTGAVLQAWNAGVEPRDLDWRADGRLLAAAAGYDIWLWDTVTGEQVGLLTGHEAPVIRAAFHPFEALLLSAGEDQSLRLWELDGLAPPVAEGGESAEWPPVPHDTLIPPNDDPIASIAWGMDGSLFYSAHGCCVVFVWGMNTRQIQDSISTEAIGDDYEVVLLRDGTTSPEFGVRDAHLPPQVGVQWLMAAKTLLPALALLDAEGQLHVMDVETFTWNPFYELFNRQGLVLNLVPGSPILTVRHVTNQLMVQQYLPVEDFERGTGVPFGLMSEPAEEWVGAAAPDGNAVVWNDTGSWPQRLISLDLQTAMTHTVGLLESDTESSLPLASSLAWSPDLGRIAAGLNDGRLVLFNVETGSRISERQLFEVAVNAVSWSPDGATLAVSGSDGSANDGQQVIRLVRASDGRVLQELALDFGRTAGALAFSPDGLLLASADASGAIQIWDAVTGVRLADLQGHKLAVTSIAFSPSGDAIATSSRDGTVRIWGLEK